MVFVNKGLGNGFVINSIDSSKDQEHYFSENKKRLLMQARCVLTGALDNVYSSGSFDGLGNRVIFDVINDNNGRLFATGVKFSGSSFTNNAWIVLRSVDDGETWEEVDDFKGTPSATNSKGVNAGFNLAAKSDGTIFVSGRLKDGTQGNNGYAYAVLRSSSDGGDTWGTVYQQISRNDNFVQANSVVCSVHPDDDNIVALSYRDGSNLLILTSSLGGISGSFVDIGVTSPPTGSFVPTALAYSGSSLFTALNTVGVSSGIPGTVFAIYVSPNNGTTTFSKLYDEFIIGSYGVNRINKFFFDSTGKIWAVGERFYQGNVLTSSDGTTWGQNNAVRKKIGEKSLQGGVTISSIVEKDGDLWISAFLSDLPFGSRNQSYILHNKVSETENWNLIEQPENIRLISVAESDYGNLVYVGTSGTNNSKNWLSSFYTKQRGVVEVFSPFCFLNQGSSSFIASASANEYFFGLDFFNKNAGQVPKKLRGNYFLSLGDSVEECSPQNPDIYFNFSGSIAGFEQVAFKSLSGSYYGILTSSALQTASNGSSSFYARKYQSAGFPEKVAFAKMRVSSSVQIPVSNFLFEYFEPLTDDGVKYFKEIDNQQITFKNVGKLHFLGSKLDYLKEFSHYGGLFQMPNLVLGTTDSGKIGTDEDAIIQVNYFGSVVKVMWPKQSDQNIAVIGFGDLSAGQRPGKLTTNFESGEFIDVTKFDHMTLYCYLTKEISGTLDNIDIKIERRPLKSTGFAVEQSIEYSSSGSDTIAELKDIIYRKQVDYGDLTLREVAYPIDIPLTNVREIRVSARQLTGQSDDKNKNFIVWGRFISSEKET